MEYLRLKSARRNLRELEILALFALAGRDADYLTSSTYQCALAYSFTTTFRYHTAAFERQDTQQSIMMIGPHSIFTMLLLAILSLTTLATAQFQFFEHMFNGDQHGQQQQPQNTGSDSVWYQQNYERGLSVSSPFSPPTFLGPISTQIMIEERAMAPQLRLTRRIISALRQVPLPTNAIVRALPASLSVSVPRSTGQV